MRADRIEKILVFSLTVTCAVFWLQTFGVAQLRREASSNELLVLDQKIAKRASVEEVFKIDDDGILLWANNVTEFCVTWTIDSDAWWTNNPEYIVSKENGSHYCFQRLPIEKAALFRSIHHIQFESDCSSTIKKTMWNSGWGADLSNVVDGIKAAHHSKKPVTMITPSLGWHYASKKDGSKPVCVQRSLQCYFLNMTNCESTDQPFTSRQSFISGKWEGFQQSRDYLEFIVRPQTWLRREIYEHSKPYEAQLSAPCTVIHGKCGTCWIDL
jgi:hypothetical protein